MQCQCLNDSSTALVLRHRLKGDIIRVILPLVGVDAEYHVALISRVFLAIAIMHQVAVRYDRLEGAAHLTRHLCSARHS